MTDPGIAPIDPAADASALLLGLALLAVLALLVAWRLRQRRHRLVQAGAAARPLVLSVDALSPRERLSVVAWDGRHYLIASGPGGLCVVDRREAAPTPTPEAPGP